MNAQSSNTSEPKSRLSSFLRRFSKKSNTKSNPGTSEIQRSDDSSIITVYNGRGSDNQLGFQRSSPSTDVTYHVVKNEELAGDDWSELRGLRRRYTQEVVGDYLVPEEISEVEEQGAIQVSTARGETRRRSLRPTNESLFIRYASGVTDIVMPYTIRGCDRRLVLHDNLFLPAFQEIEDWPRDDWVKETKRNGPLRTVMPASGEGWGRLEPASAESQIRRKYLDRMNVNLVPLEGEDMDTIVEQELALIDERLSRVHEMVIAPRVRDKGVSSPGTASILASEYSRHAS